jgi:hydroxyacylglutathione hydrolase
MPDVKQFRYGSDNLAYVIHGSEKAMVVDGGAWQDILSFLDSRKLVLEYVAVTHSHADHTCGNRNILDSTKAAYLDFNDLPDNRKIVLGDDNIIVMRTPGHSHDSVCFYTGTALISGDTLFNGTIGNCFTGDLRGFLLSIKHIMTLPPETLIYAGHDYIRDSLTFAKRLEPGNPDIKRYNAIHNSGEVYSTLADERKLNPYLRFNEESIIRMLGSKGLPHETEWERWMSLMSIV